MSTLLFLLYWSPALQADLDRPVAALCEDPLFLAYLRDSKFVRHPCAAWQLSRDLELLCEDFSVHLAPPSEVAAPLLPCPPNYM